MRKRILPLLALLLPVVLAPLNGAEPAPLTPTQIARLESLCRVWGVVKFFHPWIVAPPDGKPIDWDAALVETIPLVERATSVEEFRDALNQMLAALRDSETIAAIGTLPQSTAQRQAVQPALPETRLLVTGDKNVLVITATDWQRLAADQSKSSGGLFTKAFAEADKADCVVLDLRRQNPPRLPNGPSAYLIKSALQADIATLLKSDLNLPTRRSRYHSGYATDQGPLSGPYYSGFSIEEPTIVKAKPGSSAGKRLLVLTNDGTRLIATTFLPALQASGQAIVLYDSANSANMVEGETYWMEAPDNVEVHVRISDCVNADGTVGFIPDLTVAKGSDGASDKAFEAAMQVVGGELTPPARPSNRFAALAGRRVENSYPRMISPSREYRLLGLFRVWNVIHYFFPYKHLMDRSWDSVLSEFIPRFAEAHDSVEYGMAARELVAHLQDSHGAAVSGPASFINRKLGTAPLVMLRYLHGQWYAVVVHDSLRDRIHVGDVVLEVDGETMPERCRKLAKYFAASTEQSLRRKMVGDILRGPPDRDAVVKVRGLDGVVREQRLPRADVGAHATWWRELNNPFARKTPTYSVLPDGYGYFDLARIETADVSKAFETVKDTPALILDMRGYPSASFLGSRIATRLTHKPLAGSVFRIPRLISPDTSVKLEYVMQYSRSPTTESKYDGRVVVLINEEAQSQAEGICQGIAEAAKGRVTFIGTPTAGANGNVTNTTMPGGIIVRFSGMDVRHADGRQLQRIGIQPDIRVEPTIAGIVAGKDEVLEAAITFLNESKPK